MSAEPVAPTGGFPLDPAPEDMRSMAVAVAEALIAWIGGLEDAPAEATEGALALAHRVAAAPPTVGTRDFRGVLDEALEAARHTFEYSGPGYLAYIPGGGLYTAAIGEFLAQGLNRYVGLWQPSPAMVQLEENVTRWLCDVFDLPADTSQGVLTTGGSMANLSAVVTARHTKLGEDFLDGTYYVTDQAHGSNTKAATIAGFGRRHLRLVPTDHELRMDAAALERMIAEDRAAGARPFMVTAAAGTTNTGSVDPLDDVADVAARAGVWFHVDAAYGGFFQLTDRGRALFHGIERADSITVDPHKGMFLPYGTGGLVVRDREAMRDAHFEGAAYLQDLPPSGELPNYNELTPELSRDMRGLRVWFPLVLHGVDAFRDALDEKLDLTARLHAALLEDPNLEVGWDPQLTVIAFRVRGGDEEVSRGLLDRINASKRVFLSSTLVRGEYWLRVCIVSHRTHVDRIDECAAIIRAATTSG
ncbi:MAG TPA: aminotransferase class I/II-fold pyridoxal phosphate-dependent enzyme [Actinomycetota bacterium]|nr:aminotransferase class I/II-fold pyridoxal phosphate-dependent enzyme [Actinomycetota bacterium]